MAECRPAPHWSPRGLDGEGWEAVVEGEVVTMPEREPSPDPADPPCPRCGEAVPDEKAHWMPETQSWWCG